MYENFVLEMEWMHSVPNGNAGLFIHSAALPALGQPFTKSIEVQILDANDPKGNWTGHGDVFAIHGATFVPDRPHPAGWMRCLPSERRAKPAGQWNHYRVECLDGRISLAVNGKAVSGGTECKPRKGYICLESEGSEAWFRNLRISERPSSNPPSEEVSSGDSAFVSFYNGVDLHGWLPGTKGWSARDWTLVFEGSPESADSTLWSERTFENYELSMDVRVPPGGKFEAIPLSVRGGKLDKPLSPGEWHRFSARVRRGRTTIRVNGSEIRAGVHTAVGRSRIGIRSPHSSAQFANIFIRER